MLTSVQQQSLWNAIDGHDKIIIKIFPGTSNWLISKDESLIKQPDFKFFQKEIKMLISMNIQFYDHWKFNYLSLLYTFTCRFQR